MKIPLSSLLSWIEGGTKSLDECRREY